MELFDKRLIKELMRGCEYMYRLGAYEASSSGDTREVKNVIEREDILKTFQFLDGSVRYEGAGFRSHLDDVVVHLNKIKAYSLRNFLRVAKSVNSYKINMCFILDFYYRKGLSHGLRSDKATCKTFYEDVKSGASHDFLLSKGFFRTDQYIDMVKYHVNEITNEQKDLYGTSSMGSLSRLIAKHIIASKTKRHVY